MKKKDIYINFIFSAICLMGVFFRPPVSFNILKFIIFGIFIFSQLEKIIDMYKKNEKGLLLVSRLSLLISTLIFVIRIIITKSY